MEQKLRYLTAITIAGSDSGGGAGIQADLHTFSSLGVFGTSVITAVTAQNTQEVRAIEVLSAHIVRAQLATVLDDITVDVAKTGMLPTPECIEAVAWAMDKYHLPALVVDPVLTATSGTSLTSSRIIDAYRALLYSRLTLITPNIPETEKLTGITIHNDADIHRAAELLLAQGCRAVLIKGGHRTGSESVDVLFTPDTAPVSFSSPFITSGNLHGTGCTLASAIASYIAKGNELAEAVGLAKAYITSAIEAGKGICTGHGNGPLNRSNLLTRKVKT